MPVLTLKCSQEVSADLLRELSAAVAETIGKPEAYVMVSAARADLLMSGEEGLAAYAEIKSIGGLNRDTVAEVIRNGADGVAVVSAIVSAEDPAAAAGELNQLIGGAKK